MSFLKKYSQKLAKDNRVLSDVKTREAQESSSHKYFLIFVIIGLLVVALALYFILPKATITLTPRTELTNQEIKVFVGNDLDYQTNTIPGEKISLEEKFIKRFDATGTEDLSGYARGTILVHNEDKPLTLIPSRFETPEGLLFLSEENVKLKVGVTEVEVIAEKPGKEYNIGPTTFVLPAFREIKSSRYTTIYGKSETDMTGGLDQTNKIISAQDINNSKLELMKEAEEKLRDSLASGFSLLEPSIDSEIIDFSTSLEAGQEAEAFNANLAVKLTAISFKQEDLKKLVAKNLLLKNPDYLEPIKESLKVDLLESNSTALNVSAKQGVYRKIDTKDLIENLAGKNKAETQEYLKSLSNVVSSQVSFWPFWVKKMPSNYKKIKIKINLD